MVYTLIYVSISGLGYYLINSIILVINLMCFDSIRLFARLTVVTFCVDMVINNINSWVTINNRIFVHVIH